MIEVNLLPAELRRVEHTPLPRFMVVIVATAAIVTAGAWGVVVNWRRVPELRAAEVAVADDVGRSTVQAAVYDRLLCEIAETKERKKAIAEIWRKRVPWSKKLAQVAEMTPKFIGHQEIRLEEARGVVRAGKEKPGGMFTISSICAGADHARLAYWRRVVRGECRAKGGSDPWVGRNFFGAFKELLPTSTQKVEVKDYVETEALKFGLKMPVKPASVRLNEAVQVIRDELNRRRVEERTRAAAKRTGARRRRDEDTEEATPVKTPETPKPHTPEETEKPPAKTEADVGAEQVPGPEIVPEAEAKDGNAGDSVGKVTETSLEKEAPAGDDGKAPGAEEAQAEATKSDETTSPETDEKEQD